MTRAGIRRRMEVIVLEMEEADMRMNANPFGMCFGPRLQVEAEVM